MLHAVTYACVMTDYARMVHFIVSLHTYRGNSHDLEMTKI